MHTQETLDNTKSLEATYKQLLENQSYLFTENQRLHENVCKLSKHLEVLRMSTVDPKVVEQLEKEKYNLETLNFSLKEKIKSLKDIPLGITKDEEERQRIEKRELLSSIQELDIILSRINSRPEALEISIPMDSTVKVLCGTLTKRLEEEQRRSDEAFETIRRLRDTDEKLVLTDKITDLKQLITDLEVENTKLKYETEQLSEDLERYKKDLSDTGEEIQVMKKTKYALEDEKDDLKQRITDLENEKLKLKKDMIEELTEANRAKRVSADMEVALQHISEAYENKRKEVTRYQKQLEEANIVIRAFREQFNSVSVEPMF